MITLTVLLLLAIILITVVLLITGAIAIFWPILVILGIGLAVDISMCKLIFGSHEKEKKG